MKHNILCLILLLLLGSLGCKAQSKLKLDIVEFTVDQTDLSAKMSLKKLDGNGNLYAIVKVVSTNPDDKLDEYMFQFGNMSHSFIKCEDGVLWLYVQRNAKNVTIAREGYTTISRRDLGATLEPGMVYQMTLSSEAKKIYTQILHFKVEPADSRATVIIKREGDNGQEYTWNADANGEVGKSLPLGSYSYQVRAENYHTEYGTVRLAERNGTKIEQVSMRPNFGEVTLSVDADADIFINGEKKGRRTWKGRLTSGTYTVECQQERHRPTTQNITVADNDQRTFTLAAPQPIKGTVAITSSPSGADIAIDGQSRGRTPKSIELTIGRHTARLSKANHAAQELAFEVREDETENVDVELKSMAVMTIESNPSGATLSLNGTTVGETPYTAELTSGDYQIRLSKRKYNDFAKTVHLDVSQPKVSYSLARRYFKASGGYLAAGFQAGDLTGPQAAFGLYLSNLNIEAFAAMSLAKETVYALSMSGYDPYEGKLSPLAAGVKVGYGLQLAGRLRLTPQAGYCVVSAKDSQIASVSAGSAIVGAKLEYAVAPSVSLFAAPQCRFAVSQGEAFKQLSELSSTVKGWATGFDAQVGLSINF